MAGGGVVVVVVGALASSPSAEAATRRAEPARRDHDTGEARRARAGATARRSEAEARSTGAARAEDDERADGGAGDAHHGIWRRVRARASVRVVRCHAAESVALNRPPDTRI